MTNGTIPTSRAILADLNTLVHEMHGMTNSGSELSWTVWRYSFISALLPVVVYLEQAGKHFEAVDVAELNLLDSLIARSIVAYGPGFGSVAGAIRSFLLHLPGYQVSRCGQQEDVTVEKFNYVVMGCRELSELMKSQTAPMVN